MMPKEFTKKQKENIGKAINIAGASVAVAGTAKVLSSKRVIKNLKNGPSVYLYGGAPRGSGGFEAQGKGLKALLEKHNINVKMAPSNIALPPFKFLPKSKNRTLKVLKDIGIPYSPIKRNGKYLKTTLKYYNPDVFIQLKGGSFTSKNSKVSQIVSEIQHRRGGKLYKAVSDYGLGNIFTRNNKATSTLSSDMAFPRKDEYVYYDKFIAPDNRLKYEVPKNKIINIKNLPVKEVWSEDPKIYAKPSSKVKKVVMHWGGGHQGINIINPEVPKDKTVFYAIKNSLDKKYGKDNYTLNVLAGHLKDPIPSPMFIKANSRIKEYQNDYSKSVKFHNSLSPEDMKKVIVNSDLQIMVPGSTSAEISSLKGYKPPTLNMLINPSDPRSAHFIENHKRYSKFVPSKKITIDTTIPQPLKLEKKMAKKLNKLLESSKDYKGSAPDIKADVSNLANEIKQVYKERLPRELERLTKSKFKGKALLGLGVGTIAGKYTYDYYKNKGNK